MTTEGLDGRLPDENRRTQQQVRDSLLLIDAIERRDLDEVHTLSERVEVNVLRKKVLPVVTIESRSWFWSTATSPDQFQSLVESMKKAAFRILIDEGFNVGHDFSIAPTDDPFSVLLVSQEANECLVKCLSMERYATLQIVLRMVKGEDDR